MSNQFIYLRGSINGSNRKMKNNLEIVSRFMSHLEMTKDFKLKQNGF